MTEILVRLLSLPHRALGELRLRIADRLRISTTLTWRLQAMLSTLKSSDHPTDALATISGYAQADGTTENPPFGFELPRCRGGLNRNRPRWHDDSVVIPGHYSARQRTSMERRINPLFETNTRSARRRQTGSRVYVNTRPREFSEFDLFYEYERYGIKIGIIAIYVSETLALRLKKSGRVIQRPVHTGVILEKGRLRAMLEGKLSRLDSHPAVDDIIIDIYELILELLNSNFAKYYDFDKSEIPAHIYEAETRPFYDEITRNPDRLRVGPETISRLQATLVM